jgi:predicted unusual protein kinase regulating ubiquinone biosynthesis (AarF/ABC1/UbiB family)
MLEEVDFRKEAVNMEAFQRYIEAMGFDRQAKSPFVYQHCSTKRVLTMERLYGVPLTDLDSIRSLVPDPELTLVTALNVWYVPVSAAAPLSSYITINLDNYVAVVKSQYKHINESI